MVITVDAESALDVQAVLESADGSAGQGVVRDPKPWEALVLSAADCMTAVGDVTALRSNAARKQTFETIFSRLKVTPLAARHTLLLRGHICFCSVPYAIMFH